MQCPDVGACYDDHRKSTTMSNPYGRRSYSFHSDDIVCSAEGVGVDKDEVGVAGGREGGSACMASSASSGDSVVFVGRCGEE